MHSHIDINPYLREIARILIEFSSALSDPEANQAQLLLKAKETVDRFIDLEVARLISKERG